MTLTDVLAAELQYDIKAVFIYIHDYSEMSEIPFKKERPQFVQTWQLTDGYKTNH